MVRLPVSALVVTAAFASMLFGANVAASLYAGFATQFQFSTATLASIFAVYALVLVPSLLVFGQVSDQVGRRPVIAAGLALGVVALLLFACARSTEWLYAARATQGLAQGMMSGAATATLSEIVGGSEPRRAALLATLAQSGGSAAGALVGGIVAQWAPSPHVLPFVVAMLFCGGSAVLLPLVPETSNRATRGFQVRRPRVPAEIRRAFLRIGLTAAAVWAVAAGLFMSVVPSYAGQLVLHTHNLALLGSVAALVLGCSCVAQVVVRRGAPPALTQSIGLTLLALGLLALVVAAPVESASLLVVGAVLAGVGHGLAFLSAQADLTRIAPPHQRAEVSAAFFVCIYLGVALPVIGIGIVAVLSTLCIAVTSFAVVTGVVALLVAAWHLKRHLHDSDTIA